MDETLTSQTLYMIAETDALTTSGLPGRTPGESSGVLPNAMLPAQEAIPSHLPKGVPKEQTPFIVELRRVNDTEGSHFRPEAALIVTQTLRTSGLLKTLPAEDLSSLMYLLTFLTQNGDIVPTVVELAQAMGVPERSVRYRMERLMRCQWNGKPLIVLLTRDSGLDAFMVSPELITVRTAPPNAASEPYRGPRVASREAVIARSRSTYAKPRREVEAMIARLNNWDLPVGKSDEQTGEIPSDESRALQTRLLLVGVSKGQTDLLLAHYPLPHIRDQLAWLPLRFANNPARFIVAAIEKNFAPPRGVPLPPPPTSNVPTSPLDNAIPEVNESSAP